MLGRTAHVFAEQGIVAFRIDFRGKGDGESIESDPIDYKLSRHSIPKYRRSVPKSTVHGINLQLKSDGYFGIRGSSNKATAW